MKKNNILLFLLNWFILSHFNAFSQFTAEENEMMEVIKTNGAYIKNNAFLDTSTIKNMKLANSTSWRHLWVDKEDTIKNIKQFYDIRLKFDTHKDAVKFHKKFLGLNSEYSEKLKLQGLKFDGASDFYLYKGGKEYNEMMDPYGYQVFVFLYIVDDYFIKQHITCLKSYTPLNFQDFISTTIKRVKK